MRKLYFQFLFLLILSSRNVFSQADSCVVLGCAANYGAQTTNNSLPNLPGGFPGSCYSSYPYKQVFWQFFYSPTGGNFTQTYTPTNGSPGLDIDWVAYDIGTSLSGISCPIDHSTWSEVACNTSGNYGNPAGPGTTDGTLATTASHYYAIGIIIYPSGADPSPDANFTFDVGNPQIGGSDLTAVNCPGVLPEKLTSFGARVNNCMVDLNWTTANETNYKNYEIQYSTNGVDFDAMGTVPATSHNNGSDQKYSYQQNYPQQGNLYYRLKMVSIDGKFEFSKIIALKLDCGRFSVIAYPNPVTDILNVNITNAENNITPACLYDIYGKQLYSGYIINGTNTIDMKNLAKGIYILTIKNNAERRNIKIIR